jgi:ATP-dependent Clp protease adaptor protein ClpS
MADIEIEKSTDTSLDIRYPGMFGVVLLNDDYTPMEFVVDLLQMVFSKDIEAATRIMLEVHHQGRAVVGVYVKDIAETKVEKVSDASTKAGHPLKCILERA